MLYPVIAILIFGVIIAAHEFGHFAAAKCLGVKVNEFAIGMGPAIFKSRKGETLYTIRAFPVGGYCAMEDDGEEESADPRAFNRVSVWRRLIILVAGAVMNFITGLLLIALLFAQAQGFYRPMISGFIEGYGLENCGLQAGDVVVSVDGHRMYSYNNLQMFLGRAGDTVDFVVERDGQKLMLSDIYMPLQERTDEKGQTTLLRGFTVGRDIVPATLSNRAIYAWYGALDFVRMTWLSLGDLISGAMGLNQLSGPVGIVDTMTQVGNQSENAAVAAQNLIYLAALISVNLAVMNLLPIPALDGGRIFFLLLNTVLYAVIRKKIPDRYEGYVHLTGMAMLLALMLFVTVGDIGRLFSR